MAIDTRQKRHAVLNFTSMPQRIFTVPDNSIDKDDRFILLKLYSELEVPVIFYNRSQYKGLEKGMFKGM